MAKWGEGDPRWLVEHRNDGKNVNGWHWEEKNKMEWSKQRLAELFSGLQAETDASECSLKVERLKDLTGDATITTRKGNKKFAVFDLKITLAWEGQLPGVDTLVKGEIKVEEVMSTGDEDDYIFSVTAEGTGSNQDACKKAAEGMRELVYRQIAQFVADISQLE